MNKLFSKFITSNGLIKYSQDFYDSNEIVIDFGEEFYTYVKFFDVIGRMDVYINDNPYRITMPAYSDAYELVIDNLQIQKIRVVVHDLVQVTQQEIDDGKFSADKLGKWHGSATLQYFIAK